MAFGSLSERQIFYLYIYPDTLYVIDMIFLYFHHRSIETEQLETLQTLVIKPRRGDKISVVHCCFSLRLPLAVG